MPSVMIFHGISKGLRVSLLADCVQLLSRLLASPFDERLLVVRCLRSTCSRLVHAFVASRLPAYRWLTACWPILSLGVGLCTVDDFAPADVLV